MRSIRLTLLLLVVALGGATAASGHALPRELAPVADAVLLRSPAALRVRFNETVAGDASSLVLVDRTGIVRSGPAVVDGPVVRAPVLGALPHGRYAWWWSVTSADGHRVVSASAFAIGVRTPPARPVRVRIGRRVLRLSGLRVGMRTLRLWGGLQDGTVEWRLPRLLAPLRWTFAAGRARGMLPFAGTYEVVVRADVGEFGQQLAVGTIRITT